MNIHILTELKEGPYGGGNQFLKNLKKGFKERKIYTENINDAEILLVNSYQQLPELLDIKKKSPYKKIVLRLGPIFLYHRSNTWRTIDTCMVRVANELADLVIFQSQWSYNESRKLGFTDSRYAIIGNAADSEIFNTHNKALYDQKKIKLIAMSWSKNYHKGFEYLAYLDTTLDWNRYTMTFIGNTPIYFKHITVLQPRSSAQLAPLLKTHDIFIAPYRYEACSNAILEALACGLPVIALNSGANKEIIQQGGRLFNTQQELINTLHDVSEHYIEYQKNIPQFSLEQIVQEYITAISAIDKTYHKSMSNTIERHVDTTFSTLFNQKQTIIYFLKKIKKIFFNHYKKTWHRIILEKKLAVDAHRIHGNILDIGSKNRRYDTLFHGHITAIDKETNKEKNVIAGDIEQGLNYPHEHFDSIACIEVLEYLSRPEQAVQEIYRLLKPAGSAILTIPCMYHDHEDKIRFTEQGIREKLNDFTEITILRIGNAYTVIWDILRKKLMLGGSQLRKKFWFVILLPFLMTLKLLRIEKVRDRYYSGLFVILKK